MEHTPKGPAPEQPEAAAPERRTGDRASLKELRRFCLQCQGEHPAFVRSCADLSCALHPFRLPESDSWSPLLGRAVRAIRRYCLVCAGDRREVRACAARERCVLWPYRFGVLPATYKRVTARIRKPKTLWLPGLEQN